MQSGLQKLDDFIECDKKTSKQLDELTKSYQKTNAMVESIDNRLRYLEEKQAKRDKVYMSFLRSIRSACGTKRKSKIHWPIDNIESLTALEDQMGHPAFDKILVKSCE